MNIGILTYQFGTNFGGQLQCYALSQVIKSLGHKVTIINYIPSTHSRSSLQQALRYIKQHPHTHGIITSIHILAQSPIMRHNFAVFQNRYLPLGKECSLHTLSNEYKHLDAIIVGSDQVWAPAHHANRTYFLDFTPAFNGLKISYAPCCAINRVNTRYQESIKKALLQFTAISVRNSETQKFVKDLIDEEVPIVADPTFLYDFKEFKSTKVPNHPYILVYILGNEIPGGHKTVIEHIHQKYENLPVYSISLTASKPHYFNWTTQTYWSLDPEDWVCFIKNASFLYTDSFHGVAFALKFHIPFIAYYVEVSRASRFIDLKKRFGLGQQIIEHTDEIELNGSITNTINFDLIDNLINELKESSMDYLHKALKL